MHADKVAAPQNLSLSMATNPNPAINPNRNLSHSLNRNPSLSLSPRKLFFRLRRRQERWSCVLGRILLLSHKLHNSHILVLLREDINPHKVVIREFLRVVIILPKAIGPNLEINPRRKRVVVVSSWR